MSRITCNTFISWSFRSRSCFASSFFSASTSSLSRRLLFFVCSSSLSQFASLDLSRVISDWKKTRHPLWLFCKSLNNSLEYQNEDNTKQLERIVQSNSSVVRVALLEFLSGLTGHENAKKIRDVFFPRVFLRRQMQVWPFFLVFRRALDHWQDWLCESDHKIRIIFPAWCQEWQQSMRTEKNTREIDSGFCNFHFFFAFFRFLRKAWQKQENQTCNVFWFCFSISSLSAQLTRSSSCSSLSTSTSRFCTVSSSAAVCASRRSQSLSRASQNWISARRTNIYSAVNLSTKKTHIFSV